MSDFRAQLSQVWRMRRALAAVASYRSAVLTLERDFYAAMLRPPCRVCGNWPCTCRKEAA